MFVTVSTRMVEHQKTALCAAIMARFLVFMHIVAVMKVVLDPLRMILFQQESHHSEKQSYVPILKVNTILKVNYFSQLNPKKVSFING